MLESNTADKRFNFFLYFFPTEIQKVTVRGRWESFVTPCLWTEFCLNCKIEASHHHHLNCVPKFLWVLDEGFTNLSRRLIDLCFIFIMSVCFSTVDSKVNFYLVSQHSPSVFQGCIRLQWPCMGTHLKFIVWPQVNNYLTDAEKSRCYEDSQRYCNSAGYCTRSWIYSPFAVSLV